MFEDPAALEALPEFAPLHLPFAWRDLPRRACEPGGYPSISGDARWVAALPGGREIRLTRLHQYRTYDGVRCGLPETDEVRSWPIEGAVRIAVQLFHCDPSRVAILPPELMLSKVASMRGGKREERNIEFLPAVCSIGTFESKRPAADPDALGSEVIAVWFQGAFGPPEPGYVTNCIRAITWEELARDLHC